MKAAVVREFGKPLSIEDVDLDGPRAGEVLIRVLASGLCHSDYHIVSGDAPAPLPIIAGHEVAGTVESVGEGVSDLEVGDLVVSCYANYCGMCVNCARGYTNRCSDKPTGPPRTDGSRITSGGRPIVQAADIGGFAERICVLRSAVVKLPGRMPPESAAMLGCGVVTGVGAAVNGAKVRPGSSVAVVGCGGIGINIIQGARISGADQIIAVDTHPGKLETAKRFGATHAVLAGPEAEGEVQDLTSGGVDHAFEAIGNAGAMRDAFGMLGVRGRLTIVGLTSWDADVSFPAVQIVRKLATIQGSAMGDAPFHQFIPQLAEWYLDGRLLLDELVTERISLEDIDGGFKRMLTGEVARSVITTF